MMVGGDGRGRYLRMDGWMRVVVKTESLIMSFDVLCNPGTNDLRADTKNIGRHFGRYYLHSILVDQYHDPNQSLKTGCQNGRTHR